MNKNRRHEVVNGGGGVEDIGRYYDKEDGVVDVDGAVMSNETCVLMFTCYGDESLTIRPSSAFLLAQDSFVVCM